MTQQESHTRLPAHVQAWRKASEVAVLPTGRREGGSVGYRSERDLLLDRWLRRRWRITVRGQVFEGMLVGVVDSAYGGEFLDPAFEIEGRDEEGRPLFIKAHFALFELVGG